MWQDAGEGGLQSELQPKGGGEEEGPAGGGGGGLEAHMGSTHQGMLKISPSGVSRAGKDRPCSRCPLPRRTVYIDTTHHLIALRHRLPSCGSLTHTVVSGETGIRSRVPVRHARGREPDRHVARVLTAAVASVATSAGGEGLTRPHVSVRGGPGIATGGWRGRRPRYHPRPQVGKGLQLYLRDSNICEDDGVGGWVS